MKDALTLATQIEKLPGFTSLSFRTAEDAHKALDALTTESIPAKLVTSLTGRLEVRF